MNILDLIGNTPLIEIEKIWKSDDVKIYAKLEGNNPGGSIKDRIAKYMTEQAILRKELKPGMIVIEATSGNTGIGLAMVCSILNYPCFLVMPKACSIERRKIMEAYGANLILIDGTTDDAIRYTEKHIKKFKNAYNPNQFNNPDNYFTHYYNTAPEIKRQLEAYPTCFVSAYGTTGTVRGCAMYFNWNGLRRKTKIIAVSPTKNSKIQGLKNLQFQIVPKIYDARFIHETLYAKDKEAFDMTRRLAKEEGIFCGMSSGAAMSQAIKVAKSLDSGSIVVILADRGDRYLSTGVFG